MTLFDGLRHTIIFSSAFIAIAIAIPPKETFHIFVCNLILKSSFSLSFFTSVPATTPSTLNASTASSTVLPSGLTVVTEDASSTSTLTLTFPTAGSSSESNFEAGAALANKCIAFKSGSGLSTALILRTLENDGATPFSSVGRDMASVGITCAPDKATRLLPLLATECTFEKWDLKDAKDAANLLVEEAQANAQVSFHYFYYFVTIQFYYLLLLFLFHSKILKKTIQFFPVFYL